MLFDTLSIDSVLQSFETTLKIEYREKQTHAVISNALSALESAYKVTLNKSLYELQTENQLISDNVTMLLGQITDCCKSMALYVHVSMFNKCIGMRSEKQLSHHSHHHSLIWICVQLKDFVQSYWFLRDLV